MRPVLGVCLTFSIFIAACSAGGASNRQAEVETSTNLKTCLETLSGTPLAIGQTNDPVPEVSKPAKGDVFVDPTYKTCLVRATSHETEPPQGFARSDYSRRQAFNADNSMFLVYALDGYWHLYDGSDFSYEGRLSGPTADAEPQWHPTDPNRLLYLPNTGIGMTVNELNVQTGASRVVGELEDRLTDRWPEAHAAWTRSEGAPSADARYWALLVDDINFQGLGMVVWDMVDDEIVSYYDITQRPDHLSMSPSGKYVVVSWDDKTVAFDRNFNNERVLLDRSEHSDIAIGANGNDVLVSIDYGANDGDIFMVDLETGVRTNLLPTYLNGTATAMHFSGKGYGRPGWVLVSTYANTSDKQEWLHEKIFALELKANPRVVALAHHHSIEKGYWTEPHATVSRDFSRVLFTSNWNKADDRDVDAYFLRIPDDALPE
ncbi:MAG: hypothetical protein AB8C46_19390 [Burkholderiaceae bacterium]